MTIETHIVGRVAGVSTQMRLDKDFHKEKKRTDSAEKDEQKNEDNSAKNNADLPEIPAELAFVGGKISYFENVDQGTKEFVASQIRPLYYSIDRTIQYFSMPSWERNIFVDI
jgi:hypothetical protein